MKNYYRLVVDDELILETDECYDRDECWVKCNSFPLGIAEDKFDTNIHRPVRRAIKSFEEVSE